MQAKIRAVIGGAVLQIQTERLALKDAGIFREKTEKDAD
jgi:hypothetical protein